VKEEMIMFIKILLATDGSINAEGALNHAQNLAMWDNAQVVVVHAAPSAPAYLGKIWRARL
jgi:nucleotide-binding universal stress UspA family protein